MITTGLMLDLAPWSAPPRTAPNYSFCGLCIWGARILEGVLQSGSRSWSPESGETGGLVLNAGTERQEGVLGRAEGLVYLQEPSRKEVKCSKVHGGLLSGWLGGFFSAS